MARTETISDFKLGERRDANLVVERLRSLRRLSNYRLSYAGDGAKLKVRRGYTRWNSTALAGAPAQLFWFKDLSGNEHLLGLANDLWYKIAESGSHTQISTEAATVDPPSGNPKKHIIEVGNRVFFGTDGTGSDIGWRWTDDTAITAGTSYRVGIHKPPDPPILEVMASEGNTGTGANFTFQLNLTTTRKIGFAFSPTHDAVVRTVTLSCRKQIDASLTGQNASIRVSIQTDSAEPSGTLVSDNALGRWRSIHELGDVNPAWQNTRFEFTGNVELEGGEIYYLVIEGDDSYYEYWDNSTLFLVEFEREVGPPYEYGREGLGYNQGTGNWEGRGGEPSFFVGGLTSDANKFYDYYVTFVNSTYGIESRPSDYARIEVSAANSIVVVDGTVTPPSDAQVDAIRIYRRQLDVGLDIESEESDVTSDIQFVAEIGDGIVYMDTIPDDFLGAILQTEDHYAFDELDDSGDDERTTALVPFVAVYWKSRIIFAEENGNVLWFSKRLEKDGKTGQTGQAIPDYIPLFNKQEMDTQSDIIGLKVLADDQLVVYFKNESVSVIRGMNEVLNPPTDRNIYEVLDVVGLFAPDSVQTYLKRHVYMSSEGVYIFNATANPEHASLVIQSIFDAIESANLDDSIIAVYGNEIWVLVDSDNDGALDKFYILDLQQPEMPWREYDYGLTLNDVVTRRTGNTFRSLLAADASSNYVVELEDGTDDNGAAIEAVAETHDIEVNGEVAVEDVALRGFYPRSAPRYDIILTDHVGEEHLFSISPSGSDDIRGHHTGCRVHSVDRIRVKVTQRSLDEDELRSIAVRYQT